MNPTPLTLDQLNAAPAAQALAWLDGLYEHSPWIAQRALAKRPFVSLAQLKQAGRIRRQGTAWLLMLDEVQTGIGRTGTWFGFQRSGVIPDVMALAKGLGSGMPIGACLARGVAADVFQPGNHGSTFGGNPLACAAALATLDAIESENLLDNARVRGEAIRAGLRAALNGLHGVVDIRGEGMMIGIELDRPCGELVGVARDAGVLINVTADRVVRLVPPLIYGAAEVDALVAAVSAIVRNYLQQAA